MAACADAWIDQRDAVAQVERDVGVS
jgi:hypothetical protein